MKARAGRISHHFLFVFFLLPFLMAKSLYAFADMGDIPITEYEVKGSDKMHIIYLSGDGGMNEFSRNLCKTFQEQGYPVIAIDSKKYFWKAKTPEIFIRDIQEVIVHYQQLWKEDAFAILGYSFGADVGVFIPTRLPESIIHKMKTAVFLDPSSSTDFEIKLADMLGSGSPNRKFSTLKELNAVDYQPVLCLFSEKEKNDVKEKIVNDKVEIKTLPGDHRFNYNYSLIMETFLKML